MEQFTLGQVVRLKPWNYIEQNNSLHGISCPDHMHYELCEHEFTINAIDDEGYIHVKGSSNQWAIAPWMCDEVPPEALDFQKDWEKLILRKNK